MLTSAMNFLEHLSDAISPLLTVDVSVASSLSLVCFNYMTFSAVKIYFKPLNAEVPERHMLKKYC